MTKNDVNKSVFAHTYLRSEPELYRLCVDTCIDMDKRGWEIVGYSVPSMSSLPCLVVDYVRKQDEWLRRMTILFGREWLPRSGGMRHVAKVTSLRLDKGTGTHVLPLTGGYAVHIHQYDPCLTATVLNTLSDEEVIADYSVAARHVAAGKGLHDTAAEVLRDILDDKQD